MSDCRTCIYNTYKDLPHNDWVSCSHPVTLRKQPKPEAGDPAWVNAMTGDLKVEQMSAFGLASVFGLAEGCPTYEPKP